MVFKIRFRPLPNFRDYFRPDIHGQARWLIGPIFQFFVGPGLVRFWCVDLLYVFDPFYHIIIYHIIYMDWKRTLWASFWSCNLIVSWSCFSWSTIEYSAKLLFWTSWSLTPIWSISLPTFSSSDDNRWIISFFSWIETSSSSTRLDDPADSRDTFRKSPPWRSGDGEWRKDWDVFYFRWLKV